MTRELARDSGNTSLSWSTAFAVGRFGRIQVDCGDGEGESVVKKVVAGLNGAGSARKASRRGQYGPHRRGHPGRGRT